MALDAGTRPNAQPPTFFSRSIHSASSILTIASSIRTCTPKSGAPIKVTTGGWSCCLYWWICVGCTSASPRVYISDASAGVGLGLGHLNEGRWRRGKKAFEKKVVVRDFSSSLSITTKFILSV